MTYLLTESGHYRRTQLFSLVSVLVRVRNVRLRASALLHTGLYCFHRHRSDVSHSYLPLSKSVPVLSPLLSPLLLSLWRVSFLIQAPSRGQTQENSEGKLWAAAVGRRFRSFIWRSLNILFLFFWFFTDSNSEENLLILSVSTDGGRQKNKETNIYKNKQIIFFFIFSTLSQKSMKKKSIDFQHFPSLLVWTRSTDVSTQSEFTTLTQTWSPNLVTFDLMNSLYFLSHVQVWPGLLGQWRQW